LRNAVKLGGSLMLTWGIALGVRLLLPRYLGPRRLRRGELRRRLHLDALRGHLGLGIDTYIRKEVSVRPSTPRTSSAA
jgi:hypothetical protein